MTYDEAQKQVREIASRESFLMYEIMKFGRRQDKGSALLVVKEANRLRARCNEIMEIVQQTIDEIEVSA